MASSSPAAPAAFRWAFALILGVVAALLFLVLYVALPGNDHVGALLLIGVVALVFALVAYLGQAFSGAPAAARSISWGFAGLGFGLLFLTLGLAPASTIPFVNRVVGLIVVLLVLAVAVAGAAWRARSRASDAQRATEHAAWASRAPVNALDYASAGPPASGASPAPKEGMPR